MLFYQSCERTVGNLFLSQEIIYKSVNIQIGENTQIGKSNSMFVHYRSALGLEQTMKVIEVSVFQIVAMT